MVWQTLCSSSYQVCLASVCCCGASRSQSGLLLAGVKKKGSQQDRDKVKHVKKSEGARRAAATELATEYKQYLPELEDFFRLLWREWSDENPKVRAFVMLDQIQQLLVGAMQVPQRTRFVRLLCMCSGCQ